MGKRIDETGNRYGRLEVVSRAESKRGRACWVCVCDCGGVKTTTGHLLRQGQCTSCGCAQPEMMRRRKKGGHPNWKGGVRVAGSLAWCNVRLCALRKAAEKGGYVPPDLTAKQLAAAYREHNHRCDICGVPELECQPGLCIDHDHEDGCFRGFLCDRCNRGIGLLRDSAQVLRKAVCYLEEPRACPNP